MRGRDLEPARAPDAHGLDDHVEVAARVGQQVARAALARHALDDPVLLEQLEPAAEQRARDPGRAVHQLAERLAPEQQVAHDDRRPAHGEDLGRPRDGAVLAVGAHVHESESPTARATYESPNRVLARAADLVGRSSHGDHDLPGRAPAPRRRRIRRGPQDLERRDRPAAGADRPLRERRRRRRRPPARPRARPAARRPRRRPQRRGPVRQRRRPRDRPVADARDRGRPRGAHRPRRRRRPVGRPRRRDAGPRPGHRRRHRHPHGHRRAHARRRDRLAHAPPRRHGRQPAGRRRRHRRRRPGARERGREPRPVLGPARRRRQLRDRDLVRVPPARGRADHPRRPALLRARGRPRGAALLPRLHRGRARRADDDPQPAHGAAAAVHPAGVPRAAGRGRRGLLGRRPRARRGRARAAAPLRDPAGRRRRPRARTSSCSSSSTRPCRTAGTTAGAHGSCPR